MTIKIDFKKSTLTRSRFHLFLLPLLCCFLGSNSFAQKKLEEVIQRIKTADKQNDLKTQLFLSDSIYNEGVKQNNTLFKEKGSYYKALVYQRIGNTEKALKLGYSVLYLAEKTSNNEYLVDGLQLFGNIYYGLGESLKSLKYYKRVNDLYHSKKIKKDIKYYDNLQNLGALYVSALPNKSFSDFDTAQNYLIEAIDFYKRNVPQYVTDSYLNLGSVYQTKYRYTKSEEDYSKTLYYYNLAIIDYKKQKDNLNIGKSYINLGVFNYQTGKYNLSKTNFKTAIEFNLKSNDYSSLVIAYDHLRYLSELDGDYKNGYAYYDLWKIYSDSSKIIEDKRFADQLEIKHETDQKELQIKLLNEQRKEHLSTLKALNFFKYGSLIVLLSITYVFYYLLKKNKKNQENFKLQLAGIENKLKLAAKKSIEFQHYIELQQKIMTQHFLSSSKTPLYYFNQHEAGISTNFFNKTHHHGLTYYISISPLDGNQDAKHIVLISEQLIQEALLEKNNPTAQELYNLLAKKLHFKLAQLSIKDDVKNYSISIIQLNSTENGYSWFGTYVPLIHLKLKQKPLLLSGTKLEYEWNEINPSALNDTKSSGAIETSPNDVLVLLSNSIYDTDYYQQIKNYLLVNDETSVKQRFEQFDKNLHSHAPFQLGYLGIQIGNSFENNV